MLRFGCADSAAVCRSSVPLLAPGDTWRGV